jgi:hypothetical protein
MRNAAPRRNPSRRFRPSSGGAALLAAWVLAAAVAAGKRKAPQEPQFRYVGGTEEIAAGCSGRLEVTSQALTFRCRTAAVRVPYSAIVSMDYRSNVRPQVAKMNLPWKVPPPRGRGKKNRYFTVVFSAAGTTRVLVLEVLPEHMQPYLAEIELQSDKRINVMRHDDYE